MTGYWTNETRLIPDHALNDFADLASCESSFDEEFFRLTSLWREVIRQAFKDVQNGNREAIYWLQSKDFVECCQLANFDDPDILRDTLLRRIKPKPARMAA